MYFIAAERVSFSFLYCGPNLQHHAMCHNIHKYMTAGRKLGFLWSYSRNINMASYIWKNGLMRNERRNVYSSSCTYVPVGFTYICGNNSCYTVSRYRGSKDLLRLNRQFSVINRVRNMRCYKTIATNCLM